MVVFTLQIMTAIPIIDFALCGLNATKESISDESKLKTGQALVDALSRVGFAYLKNTGITKDAVEKLNEVTDIFFKCPVEEKRKFSSDNTVFGYVAAEEERLNPEQSGGYKEVFNVSGCFLHSKDSTDWPDNISPHFSKTIKDFMEQCKALSLEVLEVLASGLELKEKDFFKDCHSLMHQVGNYTALRSLYYPPVPDKVDATMVRLGEHSDYGTITLLFQDEVGGLEVQDINGKYMDATPIEDTILLNVGDALQYWTRGRLKSAKHRVRITSDIAKRRSVRRSAAYFVIPNNDVRLDKELLFKTSDIPEGKADVVNPMTFLTYLEEKLKNSFKESKKL